MSQSSGVKDTGVGQGSELRKFPSGKPEMEFEEFIEVIRDACMDAESAEDYLVHAFRMFDVEQ